MAKNKLGVIHSERATYIEAFVIHNIKAYVTVAATLQAALESWVAIHEALMNLEEAEQELLENENMPTN